MRRGFFMANLRKRVPENAPGDFFVDSTCIDCDACRQIAPSVFGEAEETSFVKAQEDPMRFMLMRWSRRARSTVHSSSPSSGGAARRQGRRGASVTGALVRWPRT